MGWSAPLPWGRRIPRAIPCVGGTWAARRLPHYYCIRTEMSALAGLVRTALLLRNTEWLLRCSEILDFVLSEGLSTGHYPWDNHLSYEPRVIADVIDVAIGFAINGVPGYWGRQVASGRKLASEQGNREASTATVPSR